MTRNDFTENIVRTFADLSYSRHDADGQRATALEHASNSTMAAVREAIRAAVDEHVGGYPYECCGRHLADEPVQAGDMCHECMEEEVTVVTAAREDVRRVGAG